MSKIINYSFLNFYLIFVQFTLIKCEINSTQLTKSSTENKENDTKTPREATNELPNPGEIADPSLVPVHLEKPEYRPVAASNPMPVVTENPKEESTSISTTIINLGEGEKEENKIIEEIITTTTTTPSEGEHTEIITLKPKEEQKEAGKEEETTEEPKSEKKEGEEKEGGETSPPPDTSTTPTTDIVETTNLEEQNNLDEEELIKLMTEALKRSNLAIQNVTLILPGDTNPTLLQTFLQTLLNNNLVVNDQQKNNLSKEINFN
ncbi:unnamed protein product [Meloidogyne enterolobii]|uniref:Uncharacterized protein n=1 Tax=Meloidogyne enterolobii TaxID=390850 RepID=A0ACB0Z1X1_MELEN